MYKKILLGIDNSDHAMRAVDKAIDLYKRDNSEVVVFHSVLHKLSDIRPTFGQVSPGETILRYEIQQDRVKNAEALLAKVKKKFDEASVPVETRITYDIGPQYYIEKQIDKEGFDLVLLGCAGEHSKLKRTLLGTVPEYILNHANCDVLIVK
jgi:nucleotide-binding universal stress UspA family protein